MGEEGEDKGQVHRMRGRKARNRRRQPGTEAVGIDRDGQGHARRTFRCEGRQRIVQFMFEQAYAVHVLAQAPARFGGAAGLIAHHQRAALVEDSALDVPLHRQHARAAAGLLDGLSRAIERAARAALLPVSA
jgi:hypothetical protein